jgi:hypothetical protein
MVANLPPKHPDRSSRRWIVAGAGLALAVAIIAVSLLGVSPLPASAQAAPIAQCNDDVASNVGGQGIACTVTIENHVFISGNGEIEATAPSTITMTRCTGAAGPVAAGAGTCVTTTTTSAEPIMVVQQCNGSGNGGGGVVICTVTLANTFSSISTDALVAATVYQCVGSEITGPGAPAVCTPTNTAGVTSVTEATVGQCNGSGNGGTSVGFTCTVTANSTMMSAFAVNVDQCNDSANGGGSLVTCTASVTNEFLVQPAPFIEPPAAPSAEPTAAPVAEPTAAPVVVPTTVPTTAPDADAAPLAASPPTAPTTPAAVVAPPPTTSAPVLLPADTGNAGLVDRAGTSLFAALLMSVIALGLLLGAGRFVSARRGR